MNGIIIVDKPRDWTSHDVVAKLRGTLKVKRIGHGGTLDPLATGVLPVFVGRATRAAEFCENAEKEYVAGLKLGLVTDTQDITGNTLSQCETSATEAEISAVIKRFSGAQKQIPPMYSAIKQDGKKLYELARRGIEVPRPPREILISEIELLGSSDKDYLLRIVCSKGTYIRTLCHDVGQALGCGAAMSSLRRTRAGPYSIDMAHTLDDIISAAASAGVGRIMIHTDSIFFAYPAATLSETNTLRCKNGAPCSAADLEDGKYRFYGPDNEFILFGEVINGDIKVIKGFFEV